MTRPPRRIEIDDETETKQRAREVQLLINIVEPDPEFQPFLLTDEASLLDAVGTDPDQMLHRLALYFGGDFSFSLRRPIWKLVDEIKAVYQGWPAEW